MEGFFTIQWIESNQLSINLGQGERIESVDAFRFRIRIKSIETIILYPDLNEKNTPTQPRRIYHKSRDGNS